MSLATAGRMVNGLRTKRARVMRLYAVFFGNVASDVGDMARPLSGEAEREDGTYVYIRI